MKAVLRRGGVFRQYVCEVYEPMHSAYRPTFAKSLKDARRNLKCNECEHRGMCVMKKR
jgi:hypothetical protein